MKITRKMRPAFIALSAIAMFALALAGCNNPNNPGTGPTYFTVTFETNGGSTVGPEQVRDGQTVAEPAEPTKDDHAFTAWYTDDGNRFNFNTPITDPLTLHDWVEKKEGHHLVRFITYDGSVFHYVHVLYDTTANEPHPEPSRAGHDFTAWYTDDGSQFNFTAEIEAPIYLFAGWQIRRFSVDFEMHDGTPAAPQQTVDWNDTADPPQPEPTRENHDFSGWHTEEDASSPFSFNTPITAPLTLHAHWTARQSGYHLVRFVSYGGAEFHSVQVPNGQTVSEPYPAPARVGHDFTGWYDAGGNGFIFTTPITAPVSLYAGWAQVQAQWQVSAGWEHTMGIRPDGTLWAWGNRAHGRLGDGFTGTAATAQGTPIRVGNDSDWVAVAAGFEHTTGIRADGSLWAWGNRAHGRLGDEFTGTAATAQGTPIRVGIESDWVAVSAGEQHTVGIRADGSLWAWGNRAHGRLGDEFTGTAATAQGTPIRVGNDSDWVAVSAGAAHTMGIRADGSLWAWGNRGLGRLGLGVSTVGSQSTPARVGIASDWVAVSAGAQHTMGIRADGLLWAWGNGAHGRLGNGHSGTIASTHTTHIRVGTDSDWVAVSADWEHTVGIRADGSLWAWGNRAHGRLGQGATSGVQARPIRVGTDSDWVAVSTGSQHTVGIRADGSVWAWGNGAHGRLGDGFTGTAATVQGTPVRVGTATEWDFAP